MVFVPERGVGECLVHCGLELLERAHQHFGDKASPEGSEVAAFVGANRFSGHRPP